MSDTKPQTLKGFRDFLPKEKRKRDFVMGKIRETFKAHGFEPVETPTLEYASLLLGKYGIEADKLVYTFEDQGERKVGLRYDQTVPTARILAQYRHLLPKFFRRYQIQNVFRAEKPQKGRFRELTQCDCDIFGSSSPVADAEILSVFYEVYKNIGMKSIQILINDRETLLQTLYPYAHDNISVFSIIQTIDKLDKIGKEGVVSELATKGLTRGKAHEALDKIQNAPMSPNLQAIYSHAIDIGIRKECLVFKPTLARGLDYYTGLIFESAVPEYSVGSLGGGGRYDNLISLLGGGQTPACGFAVGFDRTVEAASELGLIPEGKGKAEILVTIFDEKLITESLELVHLLRRNHLAVEIYPDAKDRLGKQLKYADDKGVDYAIIIGPDEAKAGLISVKNLKTGVGQKCTIDELLKSLK